MRASLPRKAWKLGQGINDRYSPESIAGEYLLDAQNMDAFSVYRGLGKVHGSSRLSDDHGAPVVSLNYFEAFDLDGELKRRLISLAGGKLHDIDLSSGHLTVLASGLQNEFLSSLVYNDLLFLCSPNNVPQKIDMAGNVSRWGVLAPGTNETVLENFESTASWSVNGSNTKQFSPRHNPEIVTSTGSLQVNKLDTTTSGVEASRTGVNLNFTAAGDKLASFLFFVPGGSLNYFPSSGTCVQATFGTGGFTNSSSFNFTKGYLTEGWNLLSFIYDDPDQFSGTSGTLSNVTDIRFSAYLTPNSQTQSGFLWDHLFYYDKGTPNLSTIAVGPLVNQTLSYRMTYVTRYGVESNAGPISNSVLVSGSCQLTNLPISPDPQVVARELYRDLDGDNVFQSVTRIHDNSTTTFLDNIPYSSLSIATPPIAGDQDKDHSPPPRLRDALVWKQSVVAIPEDRPFELRITNIGQPEAFREDVTIFSDSELVGLEDNAIGLLVYATDRTYRLIGDTALTASMELINVGVGAVGRRGHSQMKFYSTTLHDDGPYLTYQSSGFWYFGDTLREFFETGVETRELTNAFMVHDRRRFQMIYFFRSTVSGTYDRIASWSYGKQGSGQLYYEGTGVDTLDPRRGSWIKYTLPSGINPQCAEDYETEYEIPFIAIGGADGYAYHLFDETTADWAVGSGTEPVVSVITTTNVPLGQTPDGRGRPRQLSITGRFDTDTTLQATVECRSRPDGPISTTATFPVTFSGGQSHRSVPIPGYNHGEWANVTVTCSGLGQRPQLYSIEVLHIPIGGSISGPV